MNLFKQYSVFHIIQFVAVLALAIKGGISFLEWAFPRLRQLIKKTEEPKELKYDIKENAEAIKEVKDCIHILTDKIDTLIASDKDDIKAFITRQHHYFVYSKGWIDDYSLDCIEKRYGHYIDEGGNSFIKGLMLELRKLPKKPLEQDLQK